MNMQAESLVKESRKINTIALHTFVNKYTFFVKFFRFLELAIYYNFLFLFQSNSPWYLIFIYIFYNLFLKTDPPVSISFPQK